MKGCTGSTLTLSRTKYVKCVRVETSCYWRVLQLNFIVTMELLYDQAESLFWKTKGGGLSGVPYPLSPIPLRFSLPSQQATARIILAQRSCHIAITAKLAFLSIRNVQVHNYYTSPWLNFEVLGLDGDLTQTFDQPSFFIGEISLLVVCFTSLSDFSFNLVLKRCTCHVIFHCFTRSHINIRSFSNIKKMKFSKLRL